MKTELNIGVVGAGGFADFAAKSFIKIPGVQVAGVTDINKSSSQCMASALGAIFYDDYPAMLKEDKIDLIYIATPPYLHAIQSEMALNAGKHVICEKPAALKACEALRISQIAKERNLLYVVNLMQRYNPLYEFVRVLIEEKWLGDFVHGFFENYASDEKLIPEHWFWEEEKSGGIFIEHGVHFFDMFSGWLGEGKLINAFQIQRKDVPGNIIDRVQADVMYKDGPVNFYHGFNQPKVLDRQELRLQFDRGDITLYEWVPVKIRLHGLLKNDQIDKLKTIFPDCTLEYHGGLALDQHVKGKFQDIDYDALVTLTSGDIQDKMVRYEQLVISMLEDQWAWIKDNAHLRKIDDSNAVQSLKMAEEARNISQKY